MYHDVDQTVFEWNGAQNERAGEYQEYAGEYTGAQGESPLSEVQELELATQLLAVNSEEELEAFLAEVISEATGSRRRGSPYWKMLGKGLKGAAGKLLPLAGKVVGGYFGGPMGAKMGGKIGSMAGKAFGLELEGLSAEDQEFELSRAFVRFSGAAAQEVAKQAVAGAPPNVAVQKGMTMAAKNHVPGLLAPNGKPVGNNHRHQRPLPQLKHRRGIWTIHGDRIVLQL